MSGSSYGSGGMGSNYGSGGYGNSGSRNWQNEDRGFWDKTKDEVSSWFGDEDAERRRERDRRMNEMEDRQSTNYGYGSTGSSSYGSRTTHRGKGPKDYRRSDDRIREDVSDKLADDDRVDASEIEVKVSNAEVTLTGTVDSREAKRRAEDVAEQVSGVQHVQNNIRVNRDGASSSRSSTDSSSGATGSTSSLYGNTGSSSSNSGSSGLTGTTGASQTGTQGAGSSGPGSSTGQTNAGKSSSGTTGKDKP